MVLTRTPRMQQQQWSSGSDGPTRLGFNADADYLEARAAYDDGSTGATLPVTDVLPGRYFRRSVADGYELHRVNGSGWEWVGGSVVPTRLRFRRGAGTDVAWSTDVGGAAASATMTAGGELGTAGLVRSVAGGSFGANLDTDLSVLSATGRLHARTRAAGERAVVARAHAADAGNLFSAVEAGGSTVWSVDAAGRMRSTSPAALGGASPTTNVPLAVAPGADTDTSAVRVAARVSGNVPAVRLLRDLSDPDDIFSVRPDLIRIGRSAPAWAGGVIEVRAPTVSLVGAVTVSGGVLTAAEASIEQLTAFGGEPIVVVDALADIVSPVMGMWALLKSDYVVYRYNGAWVSAMPVGSGTTNATRHRARYIKNAPQSISSTVSAYTAVSFQTPVEVCDDVTASGTGNTTFTLNRDGAWDIAVSGSYTGNPGGGRRGLFLLDSITTPTVKYAAQVAFPNVDAAADVSCAVIGRYFAAGTVIRPATFHEGTGSVSMVPNQEGTAITFVWRHG